MTVPAHVLAAVRSIPHPRQEPDMTAPPPSPAEQAVIDRFGIFDEEEKVAAVAALRRVMALSEVWSDCQDSTAGGRIFRHCGNEIRAAIDRD